MAPLLARFEKAQPPRNGVETRRPCGLRVYLLNIDSLSITINPLTPVPPVTARDEPHGF